MLNNTRRRSRHKTSMHENKYKYINNNKNTTNERPKVNSLNENPILLGTKNKNATAPSPPDQQKRNRKQTN